MNEYQKKHDSGTSVWMERLETVVDGQRLRGIMFHLNGSDIEVMITSPFDGFNKGLHMAYFCRSIFPDGYNSDHGRKQGKALLRELYLEHKEYAAIVKAKRDKEYEENLRRTMTSDDVS